MTIKSAKVSADQTNFPVYIDLKTLPAKFWSTARSDCGDIRVTTSDETTEVAREIVVCDSTNTKGELWFKAPSLSSSVDTVFYIYFGSAGNGDYATNATYGAQNVWDSNFKGVYHLKDGTTLSAADSTSNARNGTATNVSATTSPKIYGGASFPSYNSTFTISSLSVNGLSYTISTWFAYPLDAVEAANWNTLTRGNGNDHQVIVRRSDLHLGMYDNAGGTAFNDSGYVMSSLSTGWHLLVAVGSGSATTFYIDGTSVGTAAKKSNADIYSLGNYQGGTQPWGTLDEFRLSTTNRSSTWIATEYNNQSSPSTFYIVTDETAPGLTITQQTTVTGGASVLGALSKGSGSFVIDHPLDPKNKLLFHSFVESPDVKNLYDGIATLDANGEATIKLPNYFLALNKDFRYLATPIGQPMPNIHLSKEVHRYFFNLFGRIVFKISGGAPNGRVSWQVTGIRHDPYILNNPIIPEVDKGPGQPANKGEYIFPDYEKYASTSAAAR